MVWFTGLSGTGKSTIANLVERELHAAACTRTCSTATTSGTDFTATSASPRPIVSRTSAGSARWPELFVDAGLIVLCAFISPFRAERQMVRALVVPDDEFLEIFVDTPLDECMRRDPKGLYAKAQGGAI